MFLWGLRFGECSEEVCFEGEDVYILEGIGAVRSPCFGMLVTINNAVVIVFSFHSPLTTFFVSRLAISYPRIRPLFDLSCTPEKSTPDPRLR